MKARSSTLPSRRPLFYYVTDRRKLSGLTLVESIRRAAAWGVDLIQLREKDLSDGELYELAVGAVRACRRSSALVLVNGRVDVALAAGAAGVHLPADGLPVDALRRAVPARFILGVSTHSAAEAREAGRRGADYVLFGPVHATPSKLRFGPPVGLESLEKACRASVVPLLALGGMNAGTVEAAVARGAAGVAGISMFQKGFRETEALGRRLRKTSGRLIHLADVGI